MFSKVFVVLVTLFSSTLAVCVVGYLVNACNGEELYGFDSPTDGSCVDLSGVTGVESLTLTCKLNFDYKATCSAHGA